MPSSLLKFSFLMLFFIPTTSFSNEKIAISDFSKSALSEWKNHSFKGTTEYEIIDEGTRQVLKASSNQSASGLIKNQQIDLKKTPYLNWDWKVEKSLYRLAETTKAGDDFAARIYVVIDGGVFFWRTLALNYVWASGQLKNSRWDNPFTSNAQMIAIESGDKFRRQWLTEKRNVREDLLATYGKEFRFIDAVAIMTDTDNSGQKATAYYRNIYFSEK